jgi:hypothetical protein
MTDLVAFLGEGKGTWTGVLKLANSPEFKSAYLVMNEWASRGLKIDKGNIHLIIIDSTLGTAQIRDNIAAKLSGKISDFEVALNLDSGTGKEHAALITALMRLGLSFRIVVFENEKVEELTYDLTVPID